MLSFLAHDFCMASGLFGQLYAQVNSGVKPAEDSWGLVAMGLGMLERACGPLELTNTLAQVERLKPILTKGGYVNHRDLARDIMEVHTRMMDELKGRTLLSLTSEEAHYFADHQFAPVVCEYFPEASFDIREAAKCFALERPTACVFHLMRTTEYGVQAIARFLGMTDPRPNWEPVIAKIDSETKAPYNLRQFKGSTDFLAAVSTHIHAVKVAWRNRVMHVEHKHTMQEAREIYSATRGLMRYLAENLPKRNPQDADAAGE
jgi:hypothetical protein